MSSLDKNLLLASAAAVSLTGVSIIHKFSPILAVMDPKDITGALSDEARALLGVGYIGWGVGKVTAAQTGNIATFSKLNLIPMVLGAALALRNGDNTTLATNLAFSGVYVYLGFFSDSAKKEKPLF